MTYVHIPTDILPGVEARIYTHLSATRDIYWCGPAATALAFINDEDAIIFRLTFGF